MNLRTELGEKIKRLRKKNKLTQEQFAEMIDISARNLCNIENGVSFPKPETLEKILYTLNTTTQMLFANEHIKTKAELLKGIYEYIDIIQDNQYKLEEIYKILKAIIEE